MIIAGCRLEGRNGHEAGRQLLQLLYHKQTGSDLPPIRVTPRGKPYFQQEGWHFSITHTREHAFCALSRSPVGIDAEELNRPVQLRAVPKLLSPAEFARFQAADDPRRAFLALWVLKEAEAKRSGQGLTGFPNDTDFHPDDPRVWEWDGCLIARVCTDESEGVTFYAV